MSKLPTVSWTYPGPPTSPTFQDWPAWVVFLNFACDAEKFIVHDWEGPIVCLKGDTLHRDSVGKMFVVKAR
ncbi:MAG: hypothetical protein EOP83_21190 [Verrucomicrobiaceae bacterium]|nr:MAG: hypothetical protein EOP83_21190 [Verrucomicrobiaceae bacterium]